MIWRWSLTQLIRILVYTNDCLFSVNIRFQNVLILRWNQQNVSLLAHHWPHVITDNIKMSLRIMGILGFHYSLAQCSMVSLRFLLLVVPIGWSLPRVGYNPENNHEHNLINLIAPLNPILALHVNKVSCSLTWIFFRLYSCDIL